MSTIMLLGDSIRMHYQEKVIAKLGPDYKVWSPGENGRFAKYTLNSLRFWLKECPAPDLIHWNNGLWDTAVLNPEDGCFTPIEEYVRDLTRIVRELRKTGANVIFATTTPAHPLRELDAESKQFNERIEQYNQRAMELMHTEGIVINDLFSIVKSNISEYVSDDYLHLTDVGSEMCANAVVQSIMLKGC